MKARWLVWCDHGITMANARENVQFEEKREIVLGRQAQKKEGKHELRMVEALNPCRPEYCPYALRTRR